MLSQLLINLAPLLIALTVAAVIDARTRRIPNWLTFSLLAAGLCRAMVFGRSGGVGHSLLGILVGGGIPLILFLISAVGGGDVKLLAGVGAWLGAGPVFAIFLVEKVVGLIVVLVQAWSQRKTKQLFRNSALIAANFACAGELGMQNAVDSGKSFRSIQRPLPFAVPLFVATLLVLGMSAVARS